MNPEYMLDVLGLLDDDLIREAESCTAPGRQSSYRSWMTLAACLTVVAALGYVLTHVGGMGGGAAPEFSGGAAPSVSSGGDNAQTADEMWGQDASNGKSAAHDSAGPSASVSDSMESVDPGAPDLQGPAGAPEEGRIFAVLADGAVYQATEEDILLEPVESMLQYTIGGERAAEDAGFLPAGAAYVMLEPGVAAVLMEESGPWRIFISVEP